jgi:hypothetical protein
MLDALLAGERDAAKLAALAKGRLKVKSPALIEAFEGCRFGAQNTLLVGGILRHIDFLDAEIAGLGEAIEAHLVAERPSEDRPAPFELAVQIACSMDGIQQRTAQMLIGEFGTDMTRFPSDAHFASWAAQCPGNHQSAGKRKSGKTRNGPKWLDGALHDAAMGAIRVKDGHFARKYRRIKARSGHKVAIGAVKHAILIAIYHMLKNGELYRPPTPNPDAERKATRADHETPHRATREARARRHTPNVNGRGGDRTLNPIFLPVERFHRLGHRIGDGSARTQPEQRAGRVVGQEPSHCEPSSVQLRRTSQQIDQ